jgi:hypothetical protein
MNHRMKIGIGLSAAIAIAVTGTAFAGVRLTPDVSVDPTTHTASGAFGTARRVAGSQFISCDADTSLAYDSVVHCAAMDSRGNYGECIYPSDDRPVRLFATMNPDSYVKFKWLVVNGTSICSYIQVINSSEYESKR